MGPNGNGANGVGPNGNKANGKGPYGNGNSSQASNISQDILKDMFKDDFKNLQKEIAKNPEKFSNLNNQLINEANKPNKEGISAKEKAEQNAAVSLAQDLANNFKNSYNGAKLSPNDIKKLANLMAENPKAFEKMKKNNIQIDMNMLEKLRDMSPSDADNFLKSIVRNKSLKIESTTTKSTKCASKSEDGDSNNYREFIASDKLPTQNPYSTNASSLTGDTDPNFTSDDDFNNLNISCGPKDNMDMVEEKAAEDKKNNTAKKIYIIIPKPAVIKNSAFERTLDPKNLPKTPNLLEKIPLKTQGNLVILPNGTVISTANGISTGIPKKKESNNKNQSGTSNENLPQLSEEELLKYKITVNLVGSWMRMPTYEESKHNYIEEFTLSKITAYELIEMIKQINESL